MNVINVVMKAETDKAKIGTHIAVLAEGGAKIAFLKAPDSPWSCFQSIPITDWYSKSGRFHVDRALVFPDKVDRKTGIPLFYLTANCYTRVEISVIV